MADILIVAATPFEINFLSKKLSKAKYGSINRVSNGLVHKVDALITGPGVVATTYHLTKALTAKSYDLAINLGICGTLNPELLPVRVVQIKTDQFGDFGAEDGADFLDAFQLGFMEGNGFPFRNKKLYASYKKSLKSLKGIPTANGITVHKSTGSLNSAKQIFRQYGPVVESMEGAAFFYVCALEKVKSMQIRSVSNVVEKRNKKVWKINEAVDALAGVAGLLLMELETDNI
jgi:futalosine hydrolase